MTSSIDIKNQVYDTSNQVVEYASKNPIQIAVVSVAITALGWDTYSDYTSQGVRLLLDKAATIIPNQKEINANIEVLAKNTTNLLLETTYKIYSYMPEVFPSEVWLLNIPVKLTTMAYLVIPAIAGMAQLALYAGKKAVGI